MVYDGGMTHLQQGTSFENILQRLPFPPSPNPTVQYGQQYSPGRISCRRYSCFMTNIFFPLLSQSLTICGFFAALLPRACLMSSSSKKKNTDASFGRRDGSEARPLGPRSRGVRHGPARTGNRWSVDGASRHTNTRLHLLFRHGLLHFILYSFSVWAPMV